MKKLVILIVIVAVIGGLWYWATKGTSILEEEGKLAKAEWGRVEVPISASGEARERQRVEIKAEASGSIIEIPVEEGDIVEPDQLLIRLDTEEEQRNVDRAQAASDQALEDVALAEVTHRQAVADAPFNISNAETAVDIAQAAYELAESEYEYYTGFSEDGIGNERELLRARVEYLRAKAQLRKAKNDLEWIKDKSPRAIEQAYHQLEASKHRQSSTEAVLRDAERRLRNTEVKNNYKSPCRVVRIYVSEGHIVSSAISVVGGGTPLMELADVTAMEVEARVDEADIDTVVRMLADGRSQREGLMPIGDQDKGEGEGEDEGEGEGEDEDAQATRYRDEVEVTFDALPKFVFTGRIVEIAQKPVTVAQIITFDVRIRLYDSPDIASIRLGMQGTVEFSPAFEEGLCVSYEAVHKIDRDHYVVKMPDPEDPRGEPIDRDVEVGLTDGTKVIIHSGIEEDEEFYVKLPVRIRRDE